MSILAGNMASKISLSIQFRVSSIQWVKRNNAILCLKGREFNSSSVPVRYTPKRSSKSDERENSLPMKGNQKRLFGKNLDSASGNFGLNYNVNSLKGSEKRVFENSLPVKSSEKRVFDNNLDSVREDFGLNDKAKGQRGCEKRVFENSLPVKSPEKRLFDKNFDGVSGNFGLNVKAKNHKSICNKSLLFDDARQVKLNVQEVTAFSKLEESVNLELGPRNQLMGEPEEYVEDNIMQQEKDVFNQSMIVHKIMQDAEKAAVGLLARRAYTTVELQKKLLGKRFPPDIVEAVISDFQGRGLINDGLYAETFSRSRWSSSSWGPRRIKKALSNKGVSEADTDNALKLVFEDGDSDEQESKVGLSKISMDQLLVQASKQWFRGQDVPKDTRKSRLIRWLQYRGFNWDVVNFVLKKLESQHTS